MTQSTALIAPAPDQIATQLSDLPPLSAADGSEAERDWVTQVYIRDTTIHAFAKSRGREIQI